MSDVATAVIRSAAITDFRPRVLVGCERSGVIRKQFELVGCDAWSCDLADTEDPENEKHLKCDVLEVIDWGWALGIFHPECRYVAVSGARYNCKRNVEKEQAIEFAEKLWYADIPKICIENPVSELTTLSALGKPTQGIQPWQFGHGEVKRTMLWLKNLPKLQPTKIVEGRLPRVHREPPSKDRSINRARTYPGIARAMAEQWGKALVAEFQMKRHFV